MTAFETITRRTPNLECQRLFGWLRIDLEENVRLWWEVEGGYPVQLARRKALVEVAWWIFVVLLDEISYRHLNVLLGLIRIQRDVSLKWAGESILGIESFHGTQVGRIKNGILWYRNSIAILSPRDHQPLERLF